MRFAIFVAVVLVASAHASEPGQPLDCSDWVFLEPGLSCSEWAPYGCGTAGSFCFPPPPINNTVFDNTGAQYRYEQVFLRNDICGPLNRIRILRYDGASQTLLTHMDDRCVDSNTVDTAGNPEGFYLDFDDKSGRLFVWIKSRCINHNQPITCTYTSGWWVAAIHGLTTTFEILQTYEPTSNEISFRVPYMPEGFQAADWFDTYYGELTNPIDFSQAQALQWGYPAPPPSVGDYLTVADALPDPVPGQGRYYVTAVTYQGQTRYGRKSTAAGLSGRDPTLLPTCLE